MDKNLYVCFNDSENDPTYASVYDAWLVESNYDSGNGNPCAVGRGCEIPILPINYNDVMMFARIMGWRVELDADDRVILHTDIQK